MGDSFIQALVDHGVLLIVNGASFLGVLLLLSVFIMVIIVIERQVLGAIQDRIGPNRVGPFGYLQGLADGMKLFFKETIIPSQVDRPLFLLAPVVVFVSAVLGFAVLPFAKTIIFVDLHIGFLYLLSLSSVGAMGLLIAGWASNNKYSLLGALRLVAKNIAYEIPLVLSTFGVVLLAGSMNLREIVEAQSTVWYIVIQPLAFVIFFICALAEVNRAPFDLVEAESEIIAGALTEYSSFSYALFFFAEYVNMIVTSLLGSVLFLGGWYGPFVSGIWWIAIKAFILLLVMIWIRGTLYRIRIDQLLELCWKKLLPLAFLNLALTAIGVTFFLNFWK